MVCDVFSERIDTAQKRAPGAKGFKDHRKLLEAKDIDSVQIATPDHWHAAIAFDALNAGKDVYVEKPLTLKPEEGPPIVKAARINCRICQVGMQQRSGKIYLQAKQEYFDTGKLGKITMARTWWHGNGAHLMKAPERMATLPSNLDWARFPGPVKWRDDGRTAPGTINVLLEYPKEWTATFEATLAPGLTGAAVEMVGTEGRLNITRARYEYYPLGRNVTPVVVKSERDQTIDHVENFLDCCRTRKLTTADVYIGHRSAQASRLGNIAYVQKRRLRFDPDREEILPL